MLQTDSGWLDLSREWYGVAERRCIATPHHSLLKSCHSEFVWSTSSHINRSALHLRKFQKRFWWGGACCIQHCNTAPLHAHPRCLRATLTHARTHTVILYCAPVLMSREWYRVPSQIRSLYLGMEHSTPLCSGALSQSNTDTRACTHTKWVLCPALVHMSREQYCVARLSVCCTLARSSAPLHAHVCCLRASLTHAHTRCGTCAVMVQ